MRIRQWEIWKAKPEGFERDHWFVVISGQERLDASRYHQINGLACYTLRGQALSTDVPLNSADGFQAPTACQCDLAYMLDKRKLHSNIGTVSWERQQAIKSKLKATWRL
jgi:mRNA-degrading endonuclease toxin of MazEF toxin-antitoxin module